MDMCWLIYYIILSVLTNGQTRRHHQLRSAATLENPFSTCYLRSNLKVPRYTYINVYNKHLMDLLFRKYLVLWRSLNIMNRLSFLHCICLSKPCGAKNVIQCHCLLHKAQKSFAWWLIKAYWMLYYLLICFVKRPVLDHLLGTTAWVNWNCKLNQIG